MTKLFETLDVYNDRDRLKLAIHYLTQSAYQWWLETIKLQPAANFTWEDFITEFYDMFFPKPKKETLMDRFYELKQEAMTIDEYAYEFYRLARFTPGMVPTEASRAWKFEKGLRTDIGDRMFGREWMVMQEAYEAAFRYNFCTQSPVFSLLSFKL